MRKIIVLYLLALLQSQGAWAQTDSVSMSSILERITKELGNFRLDTSAAPDDKLTAKINELRALRGPFNINEAIEFKMAEEAKEGKTPPATLDYLKKEFQTGKGKEWLDNAMIHIYRQHFSYNELKQLVKFYKTSAGAKLATDFPFIMMKSMMAAQVIHEELIKRKS